MTDRLDTVRAALTPALSARLALARRVICRAGTLALRHFQTYQTLAVETKTSPQDVVSIADREVETLIRDGLRAECPGDGLIGEEHGEIPGHTGWTWVIDPIDGTAPYLHGLRSWSVVIALMRDGRVHAGFVFDPCGDRLYWAVRGHGAYQDDRRLWLKPGIGAVSAGLTAIGAGGAAQASRIGQVIERLLAAGGVYMRNGSAALSLAHVAAGHYIGFHEPALSAWDCLAGLLLVSEAGGAADDWLSQGPILGRHPVFAAAPGAADALRAVVEGPDSPACSAARR